MKSEAKKFRQITIRIEDEVLEIVKKEGEREELSVGNIMNKILKRYVEWDLYEPKVSMIPIPKILLEKLFQGRTEEDIIKLATQVGR
ncbi:MAG: hypothetical protein DA328_07375, partial [Nitrososphaeraceae archaeon]|nr:hypothetical protein [Nitrososphaeraceae archaeon]